MLVCIVAALAISCNVGLDRTPAGCYTTRVVAASYNAKRNEIIIRLANDRVYRTTADMAYLSDPDKHIGPYAPNYSDIIVCPSRSQPVARIGSNIVGHMLLLFHEVGSRRKCRATPVTAIRSVPIQIAISTYREMGDHLPQATVRVTVAANGSVKAARILKSSGYRDYDTDALKAAEATRYRPATANCQPVESSLVFAFATGVTY